LIVSANPETLDGLQSYLGGAGLAGLCIRDIHGLRNLAPEGATAAVIFPDDFDDQDVMTLIRELRRTRPQLLSLLVTREPQRFRDVVRDDGRSLAPILLPKPSFGWDILDAIRAHTAAD
jgi:hypothetical protein